MTAVSREISHKMANMSALSAFMVVCLHSGDPTVVGSSAWWAVGIIHGLSKIAVPFFFLAAGYFMAGHFNQDGWYVSELKKRIKTLVVPYVIWCIAYWLFYMPIGIGADCAAHRPFGSSISLLGMSSLKVFGLDLFQCPFYHPMWFMRALILIVLSSVILVKLLERYCWISMSVVFSVYLLFAPDASHKEPINWFLRYGVSIFGLFWFSAGVILRRNSGFMESIAKHSLWRVSVSLIVGLAGMIYGLYCRRYNIYHDVSMEPIVIILLLYAIFAVMPALEAPKWLSSASFPVYLLHSFGYVVLTVIGLRDYNSLGMVIMRIVLAYAFALIVSNISRKVFPRASCLFFGGR